MEIRAIAITGVVVSMVAFTGACASEPSEEARKSAERSVGDVETSPDDAEPSPRETENRGAKKADRASEQTTVAAQVIDTDFRPAKLIVAVGGTVEWTQVGDQPHSVTAADGSFDSSPECGPLDSDKCLGEGDRFTHTFDEAGKFTYYCRVHGLPDGTGMTATIVVR